MGAIVGKLSFDRHVRVSAATIQQMLGALAHRAPDAGLAHASYLGHGIALGAWDDVATIHVSRNESGSISVVADADLSNSTRLRELLQRRGHRIGTGSHAELIAHAYEEWGDACVEHLAGPFAFAVWEEIPRRLLVARDAFGVRPLFFALLHGNGLVFASEMKALLLDPSVGRAWSPGAIDAYLAAGHVPAPLTMHPRVSALEPAHVLVAEGRRLATRRFWSPSPARARDFEVSATVDLVEGSLRRSVGGSASRSKACVLLSGGPASTAIAALMQRSHPGIVAAIDATDPQAARAARIASHLGLPAAYLEPSVDAAALAPVLAWRFDEPPADPAVFSQYALFVAARPYAQTAITGHGAALLPGPASPMPSGGLFDEELRQMLYTQGFARQIERTAGPPVDTRAMRAAGSLIAIDRASRSAGLRLRQPLLDRDLADALAACTAESNLLRQIVQRYLPPALDPGSSCASSSARWLPRALQHLVPDVLLHDRSHARGILSPDAVRQLWDQHRTGRRWHGRRLWALLMLELWFWNFIDDDAAGRPLESLVLVRAA